MTKGLATILLGLGLGFLPGRSAAADLAYELKSDVPYLATGRKEKLDVYLPIGPAGAARPAVVYFHGGGWVRGDKATDREKEIGATLAGAGYVFVSANYLLGRKVWPTNLEDCRSAIRYVRAHAADYGVDPTRVVAMGASAGAHLALLAAYTADESTRVKGVIDLYGITDLLTRRDVNPDGSPKATLDNAHSVEMLGVTRQAGAALWKKASPVDQITPAAPPTLIIQGLADDVVDHGQSSELDQVLIKRGIEQQLLLIPGVGHQFDLETWKGQRMAQDLRPVVLTWLAAHLR